MKTYTITITGQSSYDIEIALDEVKRLIEEGYGSGLDSNDTGNFFFESNEEYDLSE